MTAVPGLDLAIIGGTGLYKLAELQDVETHQPVTRYGAPSGPIRIGALAGKRVAFLEGALYNAEGKLAAEATSTGLLADL